MIETIIVAGLDDDEQSLLTRLLAQLDAKSERNLMRSAYYDGKRAIRQVGSVVPPIYYRMGLVLGWSAKAVDLLARRCNLDGFVWPDGTLGDVGFDELAEANNLDGEVHAALVSMLIHGVVFAISTQGAESEPAGLLHFKDATSATGDWNSRTRRMDNLVSVTGRDVDSGDPTSLALYLDGETITAERDGARWEVAGRSVHPWGVPVEAMVYKPRLDRPMGMSRISRPVMSMQDAALRTVIRMEGHADIYSFPELWLLGADEGIYQNADGSRKAAWQVMLGRIKLLPDDEDAAQPRADVKHVPSSSPEPHLAQFKQQAQMFSGETSIPLTSLGVSDMSNPTSADSYIASREDLIAEAEGTTDDVTAPLARAVRRTLAIHNGLDAVSDAWQSLVPKWRSPIHLSRAAQADAGMKQIAAVPWLAETTVGLELLGLTPGQVEMALAERRRIGGTNVLRAVIEAAQRNETVTGASTAEPVPG